MLRRIFCSFLLLSLAIFTITACTNVRKAEYAKPLTHPEDAHPAPIIFKKVKVELPVGSEIGVERSRCLVSFNKIGRHYLQSAIDRKALRDGFTQTLEMQGYDVVSSSNVMFEDEEEAEFARAEYSVNAKIISADMDVCEEGAWLFNFKTLPWPLNIFDPAVFGSDGFRGKLFLKIKWGVYDNLRRTTVYQTVSEGYVHRRVANVEGLELMISEAFDMAAHNLGAQNDFHDLLFYGTKPPQAWRKPKKHESRPRIYDPQEDVAIKNAALSQAPLTQHIERSTQNAVLIQSGIGHGSGFFITDQGHILTNAHVVGDALRVRVVSAGKKEKLIAEVLRVNKARDVALLRLEGMPEDLNIVRLPIRTVWPKVSEDVYALGAPSHTRMQDTITKGIISAHRKNFKLYGTKLNFLQADVQVLSGNSGGPLLDAHGNIVGITVAGLYQKIGESDSGLNLFIPIEDALNTLNITLSPP